MLQWSADSYTFSSDFACFGWVFVYQLGKIAWAMQRCFDLQDLYEILAHRMLIQMAFAVREIDLSHERVQLMWCLWSKDSKKGKWFTMTNYLKKVDHKRRYGYIPGFMECEETFAPCDKYNRRLHSGLPILAIRLCSSCVLGWDLGQSRLFVYVCSCEPSSSLEKFGLKKSKIVDFSKFMHDLAEANMDNAISDL